MSQLPEITGLQTINPASLERPEQMKRKQRAPVDAKHGWWWGTGRRKRAVARVRLRPAKSGGGTDGNASIRIQLSSSSFKTAEEYFSELRDQNDCYAPLRVTQLGDKIEVVARISGGGYMGQAQAVRLGIARALRDYDPTLEDALRDAGFLTRDAREVERKKYGQAGARRRFQFSKR
jgi:small subunit ribosomal protein S9